METTKLINEAFNLISSIAVRGDDVEIMAAAKNNLRAAYAALSQEKKDEVKDDG